MSASWYFSLCLQVSWIYESWFLWRLLGKGLELFSNSMFYPAVSNLLFLIFFLLSSGFLISVSVFLLLDFSPQRFLFLCLVFLWVSNSLFYAFNNVNSNSLVFNILICFLKFLGIVHDPMNLLWTCGGLLSPRRSRGFDSFPAELLLPWGFCIAWFESVPFQGGSVFSSASLELPFIVPQEVSGEL